ncbi:MAG TPA: mechanosensitive ion channel family protein [Candidatus Didemnitutus sp.]|nr:mechanosensitive ion channel family protein [Candidatus Didemnitutus sp.]
MKFRSLIVSLLFLVAALVAVAEEAAQSTNHEEADRTAAAVVAARGTPRTPDFLEHVVDETLKIFNVGASNENTVTHYVVAMIFLVAALLLRRVVTNIIFHYLKKLASKTETTLDDKLFPALEQPVATLIMVGGIVCSLRVLKLSPSTDQAVNVGSTVAFSLVFFWMLLRGFNALLDHAHEVAGERQMGIAAFMPWIKKSLVAVFVVVGVLMIVQSMGYDVKALLAGLGIGGLAFALAAQDTIANLFGSIVVAIDQPFKVGETVTIGAHTGAVEDIGLRSTKIRKVDRSLVIIPNRTVANEAITNLSRFTARRVEQVFNLTYDATPEQLEAIVEDIRQIIRSESAVNQADTHVYFRDLSASSLDLWVVYVVKDPDFAKHMMLRQRINLAIMRAVTARGLSFAFPTTTLHVASTPDAAPSTQRKS